MSGYNKENIGDILRFEGIMSQGFGLAPRIIMRDTRLSIESKAIYCYLQSFAGNSDQAFPSREKILRELKISKNRYYKYLEELKQYDYIRIERNVDDHGWKLGNIYVIVANPEAKEVSHTVENRKNDGKTYRQRPALREPRKKNNDSKLYKQLKMKELIEKYPEDKSLLIQIYKVIEELNRSEEVKISGTVKKKEAIADMLEELTDKNVLAVMVGMKAYKGIIKNKRAWIQTCLQNSIYESEQDIEKRVNSFRRKNKIYEDINQEKDEVKDEFICMRQKEMARILSCRARAKILNASEKVEQYDKEIAEIENDIKIYSEGLL